MIQKNQDTVIPDIDDNSDELEQVSDRVVAKVTNFTKKISKDQTLVARSFCTWGRLRLNCF